LKTPPRLDASYTTLHRSSKASGESIHHHSNLWILSRGPDFNDFFRRLYDFIPNLQLSNQKALASLCNDVDAFRM